MFHGNPLRILAKAVPPATLLLALVSFASAGSPRVTHVYPSGGQAGGEIEIVCKGSNLEDAKAMLFDEPGFEVEIVKPEKPDKASLKAKVKIGKDVRLGEHSFRVITESGVADLRLFHISPFPMVEEMAEKKEEPDAVQPVPSGTTVYGRSPLDDRDHYQVELKKGQRFTAEVVGARFQTQNIYDSRLTIRKEDGTLLVDADDSSFNRQDPVATIIAPDDGKYVVSIGDSTNTGSGECHYLLHLGSFVQPLGVYPGGGPAGQETKLRLLDGLTNSEEKTVELPSQPLDRHPIYLQGEQPTPLPNLVRVSNFPNILEAEPNNEVSASTSSGPGLPIAMNGVLEEPKDVDFFKFAAKKGQAYDINVYARALRSPLDSVLSIYDSKGKRIQQNDDSGELDSYLRWTAPADEEFHVAIGDQLERGGPLFSYRVEVKPVVPEVTVWLPDMVQNSSQERRAIVVPKGNRYASLVRVKRMDIGGDLELKPDDMPPGLSVEGTHMDKSVDTIPMVFEAKDDALVTAKFIKIQAELKEPPKDAPTVKSRVEHSVDVAENGNQKSFYSVVEDRLPMAVTEEVPVRLSLTGPKVPILQNGSMNLKVTAERKGDYKGPINLDLLYVPPGIGSPGTIQIKEGESEASLTISANDKAALQEWKVCVVGSADIGKGPVWISTQLVDLKVAAPFIAGKISRTYVDQGDTSTLKVALEQKVPFEGKAKIALMGLPQGVTAEPREITKDDKEVEFTLKAAPDAAAGQHRALFCQFTLTEHGEPMTSSFAQGGVLRVDKGTVAKNETQK